MLDDVLGTLEDDGARCIRTHHVDRALAFVFSPSAASTKAVRRRLRRHADAARPWAPLPWCVEDTDAVCLAEDPFSAADASTPASQCTGLLARGEITWNKLLWWPSSEHLLDDVTGGLLDPLSSAETFLETILRETVPNACGKWCTADEHICGEECRCFDASFIFTAQAVQSAASYHPEADLAAHELAKHRGHGRPVCCVCNPCPRETALRRARTVSQEWRAAGASHAISELRKLGWEIQTAVPYQEVVDLQADMHES